MAPHVHTTFIGLRMWHRAMFESAERASIDLQTIVPEVHSMSPSACADGHIGNSASVNQPAVYAAAPSPLFPVREP